MQPREPSIGSWLSICLTANLQPSHTLLALTPIVRSYSSSVSSTLVCRPVKIPALLTMTSSRLKLPTVEPTMFSTAE
jgi:hypothetical protein